MDAPQEQSHDLFSGLRAALRRAQDQRRAQEERRAREAAVAPVHSLVLTRELALVDPEAALDTAPESGCSDQPLVPARLATVAPSA